MRSFLAFVLVAAVVLMGSKCKKPKGPGAEAVDVVEHAWWVGEVETGLEHTGEVVLEVERFGDREPALVRFTRAGLQTDAEVTIDGALVLCSLDLAGEVIGCEWDGESAAIPR